VSLWEYKFEDHQSREGRRLKQEKGIGSVPRSIIIQGSFSLHPFTRKGSKKGLAGCEFVGCLCGTGD